MGARGKTLFLILASIVLTACGGGGGDDAPSAPMDSHLDTTFGTGGKVTTAISSDDVVSLTTFSVQQY